MEMSPYNNQAHKEIKESLFYLEYGRHPRAGPILVKESLQKDLNDLTYKRQEALEQAKAALTLVAVKGCKRELHTRTNKIMMCQLPIAC